MICMPPQRPAVPNFGFPGAVFNPSVTETVPLAGGWVTVTVTPRALHALFQNVGRESTNSTPESTVRLTVPCEVGASSSAKIEHWGYRNRRRAVQQIGFVSSGGVVCYRNRRRSPQPSIRVDPLSRHLLRRRAIRSSSPVSSSCTHSKSYRVWQLRAVVAPSLTRPHWMVRAELV